MKTALVLAVVLCVPALAAGLEMATLPNGGVYLVDRFIATTTVGVPPLAMVQTLSGTAETGIQAIDQLCVEQQVTIIEPFYPAKVKNPIIRELVERMYIFHVAPGKDVQEACQAFRGVPEIECADLYDIPQMLYNPNDPQRGSQWHLTRTRCYEAWDIIRGDTTRFAIIGIVDTGIYWAHPDLAPNIWVNEMEDLNGNGTMDDGDINGVDDDGNSYVDDVVGWDLGRNDRDPAEDAPIHGTAVAGDASEATDNGLNGAGIGFSARVMAVKGARRDTLNAVYQGMIYAADNGAHILNASWGSPVFNQNNQNIMNNLWNAGLVIIAAAGNDNSSSRFYPAAYNNVVAVAATNSSDRKASFSNYGTWIDVSAPGDGIYSTWGQNGMASNSGTSMSSPITAGLAALLRAAHPAWTNTDIVSTIIESADDIDDLNPSYRGMLGSGRINAETALGAGSVPNLVLTGMLETITQGDGDSVFNPGETINLVLYFHNEWADANNVVVTLSSASFAFGDSVATFGNILHNGNGDNSSNPFVLTANANLVPDTFMVTAAIACDGGFVDTVTLPIYVSLDQQGFPRGFSELNCSPLIYDVDRDGAFEIVVANSGSETEYRTYVIEANGNDSPGWPQLMVGEVISGPAVGDLDNDGSNEVVTVTKDGRFYAWRANGALMPGFPVVKGGLFYSGPLLADIDGNNDLEIIAGSFMDSLLYVINHNGTDFPGWPGSIRVRFYGSPTAGNFDADPGEEIVFGGYDARLHVWNSDGSEVSGFPVQLDGQVWTASAVGDIDNDSQLEIAVTTYSGSCYLINHNGTVAPNFPFNSTGAIRSSMSLADLNGDGDLEIIYGNSISVLHVLEPSGSELSGFPVTLAGALYGTPVVGDITGDGQPDIIIGSNNGTLYGLSRTGVALPHFPIPPAADSRPINASTAIGYLDGDGDMEIVVPIQAPVANLMVIDYKQQALLSHLQWPVYGHDNYRSGNYEHALVAVDEPVGLPETFALGQNYPNPFNASTSIRFSLDKPGVVTLSIFDLLGRKVRQLHSGKLSAGEHAYVWDGSDDRGSAVTSGIYFYKLTGDEGSQTRRMVLLK
jgi:subtilisin family serine protease